MSAKDLEKEKEGVDRAMEGVSIDPKNMQPVGFSPPSVLEAMGIDSKFVDSALEKAVFYIKGPFTFATASKKCRAPGKGINLKAHVCKEEELRDAMKGGFDNCGCGFTSTVPTKAGHAKFGSESGFNVFVPSVKEGCGTAEGAYCNMLKQTGVYCCGDVVNGKLMKYNLQGKTPVVHPDGKMELTNGDAGVIGSEEVQQNGLKEIIRQGDERTAPRPVPIVPVKIDKKDNKTKVDEIRKLVKDRKQKLMDSMKKNNTQQVPELLAATGGTVPTKISASGATGSGKSVNDGGLTGGAEELKGAKAETGTKGESEEGNIGESQTGAAAATGPTKEEKQLDQRE